MKYMNQDLFQNVFNMSLLILQKFNIMNPNSTSLGGRNLTAGGGSLPSSPSPTDVYTTLSHPLYNVTAGTSGTTTTHTSTPSLQYNNTPTVDTVPTKVPSAFFSTTLSSSAATAAASSSQSTKRGPISIEGSTSHVTTTTVLTDSPKTSTNSSTAISPTPFSTDQPQPTSTQYRGLITSISTSSNRSQAASSTAQTPLFTQSTGSSERRTNTTSPAPDLIILRTLSTIIHNATILHNATIFPPLNYSATEDIANSSSADQDQNTTSSSPPPQTTTAPVQSTTVHFTASAWFRYGFKYAVFLGIMLCLWILLGLAVLVWKVYKMIRKKFGPPEDEQEEEGESIPMRKQNTAAAKSKK